MRRDRVLTAAWMVLTAVGGMLPPLGPHGYQPGGPAYHLVGFSVLTVLLARFLRPVRAAAGAWLYGLALEGLQSLVPYRSAEVTDLAVNLVAVVLGLLLVELRRTWRAG